MLTKTKGLIMSKPLQHHKNNSIPQPQQTRQDPRPVREPIKQTKRQPSLKSNVLQHNIFCIVNKKQEASVSSEELKKLQVDKLRLLEDKVLLTQWTHELMNKLREGIMRAIRAIEEFRYLEGVNFLHDFLAEMAQYDPVAPKLPKRIPAIEESRFMMEQANPESKNTLLYPPFKLELCRLTIQQGHFPKKEESHPKEQPPLIMANQRLQSPPKTQGKVTDDDYHRMLLAQSMSLEYMIRKQGGE